MQQVLLLQLSLHGRHLRLLDMDHTSSKKCDACGVPLETVYYQRRAADEPPDKVTYCPLCPLNTSRLSAKLPLVDETDTEFLSRGFAKTSSSTLQKHS